MWNWQYYFFDFSILKTKDWYLKDNNDTFYDCLCAERSICFKEFIRDFEDMFEDTETLSDNNEVINYLAFRDEIYDYMELDVDELIYDTTSALGSTLYFVLEDGTTTKPLLLDDTYEVDELYRKCKAKGKKSIM